MKISNYIYAGVLSMVLAGGFVACDDDLEHYTVNAPDATVLETSASSVELRDDNLNDVVFTLSFTGSSDLKGETTTALGNGAYVLEYSLDQTFPKASTLSETIKAASGTNSKTYLGKDLNEMAQKLHATAGENTTVYFRINHAYTEKSTALGNMSNVVSLSFVPLKAVKSLLAVSKSDISEVYATLLFNEEKQIYEGEYTTPEWNFYLVDAIEGTIYGCDDDWTASEECNRSYKLVAGREIGDDYSSWFDPSKRPVTMRVNLNTMTWDWELIATDKKDLNGVSVIIVGADLGWHDEWSPEEGVVVTANGDEYTAVFENLTLTAGSGLGFRATEPAAAWIGKGGITVTEPLIEGPDNLCVTETGVYTITLKAVAEGDGSVSYSATAVMTGSASKKDLTGVYVIMVGDDLGWNDNWTPETDGVLLTANGDEYTAVFENVTVTAGSGFGFRATSPASTWVGKGGIAISDPIIEGPGNLGIAETGIYTFTFKAVAEDDGSVSYSLSAELTGSADKKDLTGVSIIIVGADMGWHDSWTPEEGVTVTANGDEYTAVFENVTLTDQFGFRATAPAAEWIGPDAFESLGDNLYKDGNIKANEPGIYTITVTAIATADGGITYKIAAEKTGTLSAKDLTDLEQGIKGTFNDWNVVGKAKPAVEGNIYTYTISGIEMEADAQFGFDGDLNWVGKGGLTVSSDLISEDLDNLSVKEAGTYNFTLIATANDNGTVSYELKAEKTAK
ncbi:MAG: SusF/SusE family outer membrane protein [Bacteroidales bacterium]|nr:SusF/SusE family outer membrane protein [Bacteroidales bacterium]